ncbi:lambda repressor-like predicted transcriptional regulator [Polynucleobacter sphagniphilus]|jgi:lambda repressor-like predicted transcriptional regulator|uniref:hypothetical protein n=1 Tax=Polynucleobacter sphagniphilus TaxID=1743169 RepID=UPI002474583C|nr:hypothetical protein [Polynucleobacter sphagniphilus]MDH6303239.1 lambda repressor-like predicted transcriptional regulator [Polynucleobacter sphagniphilus]
MTAAELNKLIEEDKISYRALASKYSKTWPKYQITADEVRSAHYLVRLENKDKNLSQEEVWSKLRSALLNEVRGLRAIKTDHYANAQEAEIKDSFDNLDDASDATALSSTCDPVEQIIAKEYVAFREKLITDNRSRLPILDRMLCDARVLCSTTEALAKSLRKRRTVVENQFAEELASLELLAAGKALKSIVQESLF